mmetsp:Transcript_96690/g.144758  ORF Transcript_96690/g.144758 Transcript_96690/m.144758 type:complete len:286 (+) Transcript_96690:282-1139(+)
MSYFIFTTSLGTIFLNIILIATFKTLFSPFLALVSGSFKAILLIRASIIIEVTAVSTTTTATTSARSRRSVAPIVTRDLWKAVLPIIFLWIVKSSFALVSSRAPASSSSYSTTTTTTISSSLTVLGRPGNLGSTLFARQERRTATANSCVVALFASSSSSSNDDGNDGAANDNNNNIGKNQSLSYNNNDDDDDTTVTNTIVDPVIQLPLLQAKLAVATTVVEREDLQGKIDNARMAGEFGVRKAQVDFYTAFSTRNLEAMQDVWGGGGAGSSSSSSSSSSIIVGG